MPGNIFETGAAVNLRIKSALLTTTNHVCAAPSLKIKSFMSGRVANREGSIDSTTHPCAKASLISLADTRRGPRVPGS